MSIISNFNVNSNLNTVLKIECYGSDVSVSFGNEVPYPNRRHSSNDSFNKFTYEWLIDGYFYTIKSSDFINDIKARFLLSFENIKEVKTYNVPNNEEKTYKLKRFQNLKSIPNHKISEYTNRFDSSPDYVFWCLKIYTEDIIKQRGLCEYETLLRYASLHFSDHKKGFSTVKSKCRSIINYYINKDYKLDKYERKFTNEELKMTRQENIIKKNKKVKNDNTMKVKNFLTGMFIDEYKKNGKWNILKISKDLKMSRNTIYRVLQEENL